jgi:hypothetical protein
VVVRPAAGFAMLLTAWSYAQAAGIDTAPSAIAGTVRSPNGPEVGVWVIAESRELPTKYAKVVVTDDEGRFVLPDLPGATYQVWVRGYGLVDSAKREARPGETLALTAVPAPSEAEAAQYYPGMYWYSLLGIPPRSEFPGTGDQGNGIPSTMVSQEAWVDTIKNMCQSCHALGSRGVREIPAFFKAQNDSHTAWALRTQAGQAMEYMAVALGSLGPEKAYATFADWADGIAAGELPFDKPERPKGVERNLVVTMWDWASPKHYQHDAISTDKRDPRLNANGLIWGSPEESTDLVPTLDPVHNVAGEVRHPYLSPNTPSSLDAARSPSAYWGEEPIWDGHTSIHNVMMDGAGKVWFTARLRPPENPSFCQTHPSAAVAPLKQSARQLSMYDPATRHWELIDTCFTTHHLYFGHDRDNTLWTSAGGPASGVVGWLNTRLFLETNDAAKAQGWTPIVVDTSGNGQRDDFVAADQPVDPTKDKRVMTAFYGIMPSPVDDTVWGQSMDRGFSRIDQPGYIIRLNPGTDPARTALAEIYRPPEGSFGPRGLDIGLDGVVWTALSSGHLASFDRTRCKGPLNGPKAAEGSLCPEGWALYRFPGPQFRDLDPSGSAEHAYYVWVDRYNVLGLGANVPIASANGGERLLALVNGDFVSLRVPYPLGFFTKNVDGRVDDAAAGWKGRGLWTTSGTRANFHNEGGTEASPKVFRLQLRPDPLAQ